MAKKTQLTDAGYPYARGLDGVWHRRPEGDMWTVSFDEPNCRTVCGLAIHSVHVSEYEPEADPAANSTLCACISLEAANRREQDTAIIAALPLRPRPGLYLDRAATSGHLLILEFPEDPDDGSAIIGLAVPDGKGGHYLGCIECQAEIPEGDAGMCQPCRQNIAWHDEQNRAAREAEDGESA